MKIVRYKHREQVAYGVLEGDEIRSIDGNIFGTYALSSKTAKLSEAKLLAPVVPKQVIGIGLNYSKHAEEANVKTPETIQFFLKGVNSVIGPDDSIILPKMAPNEVDYEGELVVVIGREAKNVSEQDAGKYILGYTCGNDVSARDCQLRLDSQWARGKSFDTFAPIGPVIETDIYPDNLDITLTINEKVMQSANTSDMVFSCSKLVSYLSQCMTLYPGAIIMTGTPHGVGFSRIPPVFLRNGDIVCVRIDGIGALRNGIICE